MYNIFLCQYDDQLRYYKKIVQIQIYNSFRSSRRQLCQIQQLDQSTKNNKQMKQQKQNMHQNTLKEVLSQIPLQKRPQYRRNILQIKQQKGQQPKFYIKHYPTSDNFIYNNFKLNYNYLETHKKPKSILFYFHGMYFHAGSSGYMAHQINQNSQTNVYALDFKNAGKSEGGCPGYYESVESLIDQAQKFIDFILQKYEKKPFVFISGLSMGGLITFKLSVRKPQKYKGAILLSPALRDCFEQSPYLKKVGRVMGYLLPRFKIVPQQHAQMTKYQNFQYIKNDQGRYLDCHPPGSAYVLLKQLDTVQNQFKLMKTPYICIQGRVEKSVDLFAPIDLQRQAETKDKTTIYYNEMWHDVLTQNEIQEICPILIKWIKERSK